MLIETLQVPSAMVLNASCNTFRSQDHAEAGLFGLLYTVVQAKCTSSIAVPRTLSCTLSAVPTTSSRENLAVSTSGGTCFQEDGVLPSTLDRFGSGVKHEAPAIVVFQSSITPWRSPM